VSSRLGSIRRQRTIRGVEYAKGLGAAWCGGRWICKVVAGFIERQICKLVRALGRDTWRWEQSWSLGVAERRRRRRTAGEWRVCGAGAGVEVGLFARCGGFW
jgi:hypothetical protein